jgi:PAS domain S-box-containing protein
VRLLFLEDSPDDAELAIATLRRSLTFDACVVSTREQYVAALDEGGWSAVISDYHLPSFSGSEALAILRQRDADLPFILVSGAIGEERAVEAMRAGANEYVMKDNMVRLAVAVEREIRDAEARVSSKKLQAELQRAEERYRRTFEKAPIGIVSVRGDGFIIEANEAFCAIVGFEYEGVAGRHFTAFLHDRDRGLSAAQFSAFMASDAATTTYERRYSRPNGKTAWALVTLAKVFDEGGVDYVIVLVKEITERKLAAEALQAQQDLLAEAERIAGMGSWQRDLASGRLAWSDELSRIYGLDPHVVPDLDAIEPLIDEGDLERLRAVDSAGDGTAPLSTEIRLKVDGRVRTLNVRRRTHVDASGRPVKQIGIVQDITDRIEREEELRRTAVQQAVVANIGRIALAGASIEFLLRQTAMFIATVLDLDFSEVLQKQNGHLRLVAGEGWDEAAIGTTKVNIATRSQAAFTLDARSPVVVTDMAAETRFIPSELVVRHGAMSGLTVAIEVGEGQVWGVLGGYSRSKCQFTTTDVDFLRSVAIVIGQAIERDRADAVLRTRAAQQSAIAELGRATLQAFNQQTLEQACALVAAGLGTDHACFAERIDNMLRHRAGIWPTEVSRELPISTDSQLGRTLVTGRPVIIDDYQQSELSTAPAAARLGLVSGLTVPVVSATQTFGALGALHRSPRPFDAADIDFMQSMANILADAMDRDRTQRALAESERRYRSVVEGASEVIFTVDGEGRIITLNPAFEVITGWPVEEWIGREFAGLIAAEQRQMLLDKFQQMFQTLKPFLGQVSILGRNGVVLLDVQSFPQVRDGGMTGVYGFARDITEERRAEEERQQLTRSLQLVLDSTVDGIYTMDVEGRCTMINASAARMLAQPANDFIGENMHDIVHSRRTDGSPYPEEDCPIRNVLRTGSARTITSDVFWRHDGTSFPVDFSAAPIIDDGVTVGAVIAFTDVSERRKLEAKLEQANRLSSLGRMAATIAHEFNNVLMGISPFVDLIRRRPECIPDALEKISRSVARGKGITHDILRYTRPAEPKRSHFNVEAWLGEMVAEARSILPVAHQIDYETSDAWLAINADANQLHQIFTNLVVNARDAMPAGGRIHIAVRREPRDAHFSFGVVDHPERFAHFIVSDTGPGIPPQTLDHIFEPLFTTKANGTGLGLAVAHQVVHLHGGEIFAESEVGAGTSFHIFVPLAPELPAGMVHAEAAGEMPQEHPMSENEDGRADVHVLLVEDDEAVAAGLLALLEVDGLTVDLVGTGAEAIDFLEQRRPDVVVLDVGLPDMDGTSVYSYVQKTDPKLPVIFSTGHADRARLDELSPGRPVLYLSKPFDGEVLLQTIASAVA